MTQCFSFNGPLLIFFLYVSNISMCCEAAGNRRLLLRVDPKDQAVCHSSWRSALYSEKMEPGRPHTCEFITMNIQYRQNCNTVWQFLPLKTNFSRMFPQAPRCDQQRSDCSNSRHHPPAPPLLKLLAFLQLTIGQHFSPSSVGRRNAPPWHGGWLL